MKKIFSYAMAAAVAFGLASCSKDVNHENGADGGLVATFTLQTPKGAFVTYAGIAEGEEWTVNNVDIYAFDKNAGTMIGTDKLAAGTDYEVTSASGAATTTIKVNASWLSANVGKEVYFYFVGNDVAGAGGAIKAPHVDASKNTIAAFEAQVTKALAIDGDPKMTEIIRTPLLFSAKSELITIQGRQQAKATLTRREARFDIVNAYAAEAFPLVVEAIQISNAPRSGKIFADGGTETVNFASIDGTLFTMPAYSSTLAAGKYGDYWQETDAQGATTYRYKSAFYLYPTTLGEGAAHTQIVIKATMNGVTEYYTRATKDALGVAIPEPEIVANYRYTLVLNPLSLTFDIVRADYEEGGIIDTEAGGDDSFTGFSINASGLTPANWKAATRVYTFDGTVDETMTVTLNSQYGSAFKVETVIGDDTQITNYSTFVSKGTPVVTYGRKIEDTYTIKTPLTSSAGLYSIRVTIYSPNGDAKETILFQKGTLDTNAIANIVNGNEELAKVIENIIKAGNGGTDVTPGDIENITTINVGGAAGPSTLDGIENLPKLTEINAVGNTNLTEKVDLSGNPGLVTAELTGTSVTSVVASNNPALEVLSIHHVATATEVDVSGATNLRKIYLRGTSITSLDVSNNPKLTTISARDAKNLTLLDVSKNPEIEVIEIMECLSLNTLILGDSPKLWYLPMYDTNITELDVTQCPALKYLSIMRTGITELDLSKNPLLTTFQCSFMKGTSLKVWVSDTFPKDDPTQKFTEYQDIDTDITYDFISNK